MAIRTGILFVPRIDESTTSALIALFNHHQFPVLLIHEAVVGSQRNWIEETLRRWSDEDELDLILTVGGTMPAPGPSQAECVPEATGYVIERSLAGFSERMRSHAFEQTPLAILHRGICGIRGRTLIVNLPKGAASSVLFLEAVIDLLPPVIDHLQGTSKLSEIEDDLELVEEEHRLDLEGEIDSKTKKKKFDADEFAAFLQRENKNRKE